MWELLGTPKTYSVTKKLASEFAEMEGAPNDRPLSERRLAIYERILRAGEFRPCTWAKCQCDATGQTYRINGKHTSRLFSGVDDANLLASLVVTVESYKADDLESMARLYATFDARLAVRTTADVVRSFAGSLPELSSLPLRLVTLAVTGLSWADDPTGWFRQTSTERAEKVLDNVEFILWLHEIFAESESCLHLRRGPVVGAMCATWRKSHKAAVDFWSAVRDETSATPTTPDRRLARFLLTTSVGSGMGVHKGISRTASPMSFFVKSIHAWNAWRKNVSTDLKFHAGAKVPAIQ
jgi:hypothetical protein